MKLNKFISMFLATLLIVQPISVFGTGVFSETKETHGSNLITKSSGFEPEDVTDSILNTTTWAPTVWTQGILKDPKMLLTTPPALFPEWRAAKARWNGKGTITFSNDVPTDLPESKQSLLMDVTTAGTSSSTELFLAKITDEPVIAGKEYEFSFWLKSTTKVETRLYEVTNTGTHVGNSEISNTPASDEWVKHTIKYIPTKTDNYFKINMMMELNKTGKIWTDEWQVREVLSTSDFEISLNKNDLQLNVGDVESLIATITPDAADYGNLVWSSSDVLVATITDAGSVEAVAEGSATITVHSDTDTTKTATVNITVKANSQADSITLNPNFKTLKQSESFKITTIISPEGAELEWSSSDETIAKVDNTGIVTSQNNDGSAKIIAKIKNNPTVFAVCDVKVLNDSTIFDNMIMVGSGFNFTDIMSEEEANAASPSIWPTSVWTDRPLKNYIQEKAPSSAYFSEWRALSFSASGTTYGEISYDNTTKIEGDQSLLLIIHYRLSELQQI